MTSRLDNLTAEKDNYDFFLQLPEIDPTQLGASTFAPRRLIRRCSSTLRLLGLRRMPYIKLLDQLYGDRLLIANAFTGCSSIYGGNPPTTPHHQRRRSRPGVGQPRCSNNAPNSAWASV